MLLAAVSLTWQAVTFRLTGSKVIAHLRVGVLTSTVGGQGFITHPVKRGWDQQLAGVLQQYGGIPVLELEASNVGRLAVGMEDAAAVTDFGARVALTGWDVNPERGTSLNGGHRASWYARLPELQLVVDSAPRMDPQYNRPIECWMELNLGNGKTAGTREKLVLVPHLPATGVRVSSSAPDLPG